MPYNRNSVHVECGSKSDTSNNKSNWNHLRTTQTVPEQHTGKERDQGTTKNSYIFGTAHILREVLMWRNRTFVVGNNITCSVDCKYRTAATLYTP